VAPIYSVRFAAVTGVDIHTVVSMTFPAGDYTYVLRDMDVFLAGEGGGGFTVHDSYGGTIWAVNEVNPFPGLWQQWTGREVYAPGDILYFGCDTADPLGHGDWSASGYALTGPVPFPPQV
jgi:hypothetical protein